MDKVTNRYTSYIHENGGRVFILFLLFLLALYELYTAGIGGFAIICCLPLLPLFAYISLKNKMAVFWTLFYINYLIMGLGRYVNIPIPITLITELIEVILIGVILIDIKDINFKYIGNFMFFSLMLWVFYMFLEIFNNTCQLDFHIDQWFINTNQFALQFLFAFIIVGMLINSPQRIMKFLRIWAILSMIAVFWAWRQKTFGFDKAENTWLWTYGAARTHIIGGSIRYFSFFSDAANFGCNMAASTVAFYIIGITSKIKRDKWLFIIAGLASTYGMFASGTRTAIVCFMLAIILYVFLSRSIKIAIPVTILFALFVFVLAFTKIGNGNMMIRRMRTTFDTNDASKGVRDVNKESLVKYMKDAPWGLGISIDPFKVPANNKYKIVTQTASDSTYVYLWEYTGIIGEILFIIVNVFILLGGCYIVLFRLHNKALRGIAASFCCAFTAINIGGYGNNILMQYPNIILLYGGMTIAYLLPKIESDYNKFEKLNIEKQEEKKRLKLEKKRESRV